MINEYGAVGGTKFGRLKQSTRRKVAAVSLYAPQISHDLFWYRTLVIAVGSWQLTG
jgi:hypothetical protein